MYLHPDMERLREMIQLLVPHGADLSVRKKDGKTLFDRASARGLNDFADAVRDRGARTAVELTTAGECRADRMRDVVVTDNISRQSSRMAMRTAHRLMPSLQRG